MNIPSWLKFWKPKLKVQPVADTAPKKKKEDDGTKINEANLVDTGAYLFCENITHYKPPVGVANAAHVQACDSLTNLQLLNSEYGHSGFPGYYRLSQLATVSEYRDMSGRLADEMTRKWIKLRAKGETDMSDKIAALEEAVVQFNVRDLFRRAAELDGLMGRSQIFIDMGVTDTNELKTPLLADKAKVQKGALKGLRIIEPHTTYPGTYNADDALRDDYYTPRTWYVNTKEVHASRLPTFIGRELPVLLRPAYNFGGISISQLAEDCVNNWFKTRSSVSRLVSNFSTSILKTNMQGILRGGPAAEIVKRAKLFTNMRDNQGLFLLDNQTEDFTQVNTPLSGLNLLQAQSQEHMASVAKIPLVILLGISPTGLNASSEGEIRVFYDYVSEMQNKLFRPNLEFILRVLQLHVFGTIEEEITFDFVPLYALTADQEASIRTSDANAAKIYIDAGVVAADEERKRIAKDPNSGYNNLDLSRKIEKPNPLVLGGDPNNATKPGPGQEVTKKPGAPAAEAGKMPKSAKTEDAAPFIFGSPGPSFFGNQHTGTLEEDGDTEYAIAAKHSAVAYRAHATALQGTFDKRNHERAIASLQRALYAWEYLLGEGSGSMQPVCEAYISTIKSMIDQHTSVLASRATE